MKYTINASVFANTFAVPSIVADKYLKTATLSQIKVLLYFMRNISEGIDIDKISAATALPPSEVEDALIFWLQCDVLIGEQPAQPVEKKVIVTTQLPSRADIIKRGLEDERLAFLLREAQLKFDRNLKQNENQLLVSLYDDHGMDVSVILLLLGYARSLNKCNISFLKSTATKWLNAGVETVLEAERLIADAAKQKLAWDIVQKIFGIEKRNPSAKELELSNLWINEWGFSTDMLKAAYDICVNANTKLSMPYIAKILERWHKEGVSTPDQIKSRERSSKPSGNSAAENKKQKRDYAGYDLDLFEKMLNDKINRKE